MLQANLLIYYFSIIVSHVDPILDHEKITLNTV